MVPLILAAFSTCFPKPRPDEPLGPGTAPGTESPNVGARSLRVNDGRKTRESDSHIPPERIVLAATPRMSPMIILRHPMEKRKKPETRANSRTWCERTVPPIRHWNTPRGPSPNSGPTTGKNLSNSCGNQSISEKASMVTWAMMNNRLITAQAIPPRWPGMVLFLDGGVSGLARDMCVGHIRRYATRCNHTPQVSPRGILQVALNPCETV